MDQTLRSAGKRNGEANKVPVRNVFVLTLVSYNENKVLITFMSI